MTNDERLQLIGALLVKSLNDAGGVPEPLRTLISDANEAMTKEQKTAQFALFDQSGISGFDCGLYADLQPSMKDIISLLYKDPDSESETEGETETAD